MHLIAFTCDLCQVYFMWHKRIHEYFKNIIFILGAETCSATLCFTIVFRYQNRRYSMCESLEKSSGLKAVTYLTSNNMLHYVKAKSSFYL